MLAKYRVYTNYTPSSVVGEKSRFHSFNPERGVYNYRLLSLDMNRESCRGLASLRR